MRLQQEMDTKISPCWKEKSDKDYPQCRGKLTADLQPLTGQFGFYQKR